MLDFFRRALQSLIDFISSVFSWFFTAIQKLIIFVYDKFIELCTSVLTWFVEFFEWITEFAYLFLEEKIINFWNDSIYPCFEEATAELAEFFSTITGMFPAFPNVSLAVSYFLDVGVVLSAMSVSFTLLLSLLAVKIILKLIPTIY